jgi:PAS domain S-box-containing protein
MMRTPVETVVGSRIQRFLAPERQAMFAGMLAGEKQSKRNELPMLAADGANIPVSVSLNRLNTGGIQTVCAVITDLTEQRHYEAMVKDGELSRLILDQAAEAIVVIDARGKILRASESAVQLAGRSILLEHFDAAFQLWGAANRITTAQLLSGALSARGFKSIEVQMLHHTKPVSTLLLSTGPLWAGTGELLGCVVTLTDITERKKSEQALAMQAQALERSNSDLRQFTYAVSHDLREPTRILAIYSQLLERNYKGKLDGHADEFIQHTVQAAHRLEGLLDDLLAYTQTAESPQTPDCRVDANMALSQTLAMFATRMEETGARATSDPLPVLRMHEVHLQQLFQNLIGNSLKYRSEAPLEIHVSARREGDLWILSVADNGIGIEPQYGTQIFGLFKRLHGGNKYAGSGIGLAICQKIVERYGGRIWVESELGKGSTFLFALPGDAAV